MVCADPHPHCVFYSCSVVDRVVQTPLTPLGPPPRSLPQTVVMVLEGYMLLFMLHFFQT